MKEQRIIRSVGIDRSINQIFLTGIFEVYHDITQCPSYGRATKNHCREPYQSTVVLQTDEMNDIDTFSKHRTVMWPNSENLDKNPVCSPSIMGVDD